jgi:hypothetical protein
MLQGRTYKEIRLLQIEDPILLIDGKNEPLIRAWAEHAA